MTQQRSDGSLGDPSEDPSQDLSSEASALPDPQKPQLPHKPQKPQKSYRLKMMVLVRILAEVAALCIIGSLPFIFLGLGKFQIMPLPWKVAFSIMSAVALAVVPFYGFVTWKVRTDDDGLTTVTAFKRKTVAWNELRSLVKRSTWNFPRYVIEATSGEVSFPIWLDSLADLLELIKTHLPAGSASFNPYRKFNQDAVLLAMHMAQSAAGILFLSVLWFFYAESLKKGNHGDSVVVLIFCVVASAILLWRTYMILFMPLSVEVKIEFVVIRTCFNTVALPWADIVSVKPTIPLLPEGFLIKTKKGSYLIGNGMDRSDELEQALSEKLSERLELEQKSGAAKTE